MKKNIFVQPQGGLCNRMRTITGAISLAQRLNRIVTIIWTRDPSLNIAFNEIFSTPLHLNIKVIECSLSSIKYKIIYHFLNNISRYTILDDTWIYKNARGLPFETWEHLVRSKRLFIISSSDILFDGDYSIFTANPQLLKSYNTVKCDSNTIGIHIRRTDNAMAIKHSPTYLFIQKLEEELSVNPNSKFYLATDDPIEEKIFTDKFGDKIIIYQKHSLDRNDPIAIKDALIDLYNLSCCKKIYASYWSSFSDVAAYWGGIEKKVLKI